LKDNDQLFSKVYRMRSYYSAQRFNRTVEAPKARITLKSIVEATVGMALMSSIPAMGVYCFFQILMGNG